MQEIFVFGSNLSGIHGAGAARYALLHHGAVMGQGMGLQGTSYALPTKGVNISFMPLNDNARHVMAFISFTKIRPDLTFRVTRVGCGRAGFKDEQIAPLFKEALPLKNIRLPKGWRHLILTGENTGISDDPEELIVPVSFDQALVETKKSLKDFKDFLSKPIEAEGVGTEELWGADLNCDHDIQPAPGGGVKCTKCPGWFCY